MLCELKCNVLITRHILHTLLNKKTTSLDSMFLYGRFLQMQKPSWGLHYFLDEVGDFHMK
jgi:hypothetical protein